MNCPSGKMRYDTRAEAKRILLRLQSRGRRECSVYRCVHCNGFHLTSQRDRRL